MSGAFSFGFDADEGASTGEDSQSANVADSPFKPVDDLQSHVSDFQHFSMQEMLTTLPSELHFTWKTLPNGGRESLSLPQRDFSDLKAQLMAEDEDIGSISGISADDREPGIYEGGLKTWECADDLSSFLLYREGKFGQDCGFTTVIELGAGTAQPTCSLLLQRMKALSTEAESSSARLKLILADYNRRVLEVTTVPNLLLSIATSLALSMEADMLELLPEVKKQLLDALASYNIDISTVSGSWSSNFAESILSICPTGPRSEVLILGSETVYAPKSINIFAETIMHMLRTLEQRGTRVEALIATKKVYFGVGGGLNDFVMAIRQLGGTAGVVWQSADHSVGRAIVAVSTSVIQG